MNHLDLFSGIGGFALAASVVWGQDHNIVAFVERDKYCQKVLAKHWPDAPIIDDVKGFRYEDAKPTIDLLTGGFPCQPFSVAGKRKGKEDDRYLWPEMFRIIQEAKPTWIIGENVPGIINMGLETTVLDLEAEGYEVEILVLPACGVGAWHQRYRVWIVCHSEHTGLNASEISKGTTQRGNYNSSGQEQAGKPKGPGIEHAYVANANKQHVNNGGLGAGEASQLETSGIFKGGQWGSEPSVGRRFDDVPHWLDRNTGGLRYEESKEAFERFVRSMWAQGEITGSSYRPANKKQPEGEHSNSLQELSRLLAYNGKENWRVPSWEDGIPRVAQNTPNRVDRLKGLGNAIVPQCVAPIMEAIKRVEEIERDFKLICNQ